MVRRAFQLNYQWCENAHAPIPGVPLVGLDDHRRCIAYQTSSLRFHIRITFCTIALRKHDPSAEGTKLWKINDCSSRAVDTSMPAWAAQYIECSRRNCRYPCAKKNNCPSVLPRNVAFYFSTPSPPPFTPAFPVCSNKLSECRVGTRNRRGKSGIKRSRTRDLWQEPCS